jgi:hypothetical protein
LYLRHCGAQHGVCRVSRCAASVQLLQQALRHEICIYTKRDQ